jgi:arylsulfatase A-like enzyme
MRLAPLLSLTVAVLHLACGRTPDRAVRPDLLLVTLDTTRADLDLSVTPSLAALGARGVRFTQAYATAPQTLPSHASMLTGLYPAAHGVRENARRLAGRHELIAERLARLGYQTAALVSGFPLERQFGLDRGFEVYDDELPGGTERSASATTERALSLLSGRSGDRPLFLWVHYYDPHDPYSPPEPFRARFAADPYLGEIAAMDEQLGRLTKAFERVDRPSLLIALGDHGEGRGDHGEMLHGNLLYQGVMRVPLVIAGTGVKTGDRKDPVSARQVFATLLDRAGESTPGSLLVG